MKRILLFASMLFILSCTNRGTMQEFDRILLDGNYNIECKFQGCFGAGTERLQLNGKTATYTFLDFSEENGPTEKTRTIPWTGEKENKLRELFDIGIHLQDTLSMCTTTTTYVLRSWPNSIEFEDLNCKVTEKFGELVE